MGEGNSEDEPAPPSCSRRLHRRASVPKVAFVIGGDPYGSEQPLRFFKVWEPGTSLVAQLLRFCLPKQGLRLPVPQENKNTDVDRAEGFRRVGSRSWLGRLLYTIDPRPGRPSWAGVAKALGQVSDRQQEPVWPYGPTISHLVAPNSFAPFP